METLLTILSLFFDRIYFGMVSPLFSLIGRALEYAIITPLDLLGLPAGVQVMAAAGITALISLKLRQLLEVEARERAFRELFRAKKKKQENLALVSDWKSRDAFYRATDNEIDEDFNTYLAQRFARQGIVYLLPVFLALFWLTTVFAESPFVVGLPENPWNLPGLSIQLVFLGSYCTFLFSAFRFRKRTVTKTKSIPLPIPGRSAHHAEPD